MERLEESKRERKGGKHRAGYSPGETIHLAQQRLTREWNPKHCMPCLKPFSTELVGFTGRREAEVGQITAVSRRHPLAVSRRFCTSDPFLHRIKVAERVRTRNKNACSHVRTEAQMRSSGRHRRIIREGLLYTRTAYFPDHSPLLVYGFKATTLTTRAL